MSDTIVQKLKKYVLYISTAFFVWLGAHLIYSYLYDGAGSVPVEGGAVSEALIGSFPHFNPLVPSDDTNAYINGLLYRSMLIYDLETETYAPDLMNCNLDNLLEIECALEQNLKWSDESAITTDDIKATLSIISQTQVNPIIASLLENTEIEATPESIVFKNTKKDINFLQIFRQPILPKTVIQTLDSENVDGKFSEIGGVYSGRFILTNINQDDTVGVTKITLEKNPHYFGNDMYIQFLILNLYQNEAHFLKNKNSFNIFNDKNGIIGSSIPRLELFPYTLSQFVGTFLNTETIGNTNIRRFVFSHISRDEVISSVGSDRVIAAMNPFLSETDIDPADPQIDFPGYLEGKGYYPKKELIKLLKEKEAEETQQETPPEEIISQEAIPEPKKPTQSSLEYITKPNNQKYNFISEDNVLVSGRVDPGTQKVYINDYELTGFNEWDSVFNYRLLESYDSIKPGENTYVVSYEIDGQKEEKDTFYYIYEPDEEKLAAIEADFFDTSTPEPEATPEPEVPQKPAGTFTSADAGKLDQAYYYNLDGNPYKFQLVFAQTDPLMEKAANSIASQLKKLGILVESRGLPLGDITKGMRDESLKYDIMLIGINLGYFDSNIFPYFHSSQVKNGYNFSNYTQLSLDILLEELKGNNLSQTKKTELEEKILKILKEGSVVKTYYTPKIQLLVDKNIKQYEFPDHIPDSNLRYIPLLKSYFYEKRSIQFDEKWFIWFFGYLFRELF